MKQSPYLLGAIFLVVILTTFLLSRSLFIDNETLDDYVPPPNEVLQVLAESGLSIEGSQVTTLRWIADIEEFVSVNLSAQSYGLGFMSKSRYDDLVERLLVVTQQESTNDASSDLAGQRGFRTAGRACIVGFTYSDSLQLNGSANTEDREVYSIIVCSRG